MSCACHWPATAAMPAACATSFVCTQTDSKLGLHRWQLHAPRSAACRCRTAANCPTSDLQHPAGFAADNAAELAQLVVKSLAEYADSDSQRSVQRLVDAAVAQDAFLKALAGGIVKNEKAKLKPHVGAASTAAAAGSAIALPPYRPGLSCCPAARHTRLLPHLCRRCCSPRRSCGVCCPCAGGAGARGLVCCHTAPAGCGKY